MRGSNYGNGGAFIILELLNDVINFVIKAIKWIFELSLKRRLILLIIVLLPILWWKIPDPNSVEVDPFFGEKIKSPTVYVAKVSEVEVSFSLSSELIGQISSLSKHKDIIELVNTVNSVTEQTEKLKVKTKEFEIPIDAGKYSSSGVTIYAWEKSYRRFFTKDTLENTLFEYNLVLIWKGDIFYFK